MTHTKADFDRALEKLRSAPDTLSVYEIATLQEFDPNLVQRLIRKSASRSAEHAPRPPAPVPYQKTGKADRRVRVAHPTLDVDAIATRLIEVVDKRIRPLEEELRIAREENTDLKVRVAALEATRDERMPA
jgi:hypothetical protein